MDLTVFGNSSGTGDNLASLVNVEEWCMIWGVGIAVSTFIRDGTWDLPHPVSPDMLRLWTIIRTVRIAADDELRWKLTSSGTDLAIDRQSFE